jgi:hypothetical protein
MASGLELAQRLYARAAAHTRTDATITPMSPTTAIFSPFVTA